MLQAVAVASGVCVCVCVCVCPALPCPADLCLPADPLMVILVGGLSMSAGDGYADPPLTPAHLIPLHAAWGGGGQGLWLSTYPPSYHPMHVVKVCGCTPPPPPHTHTISCQCLLVHPTPPTPHTPCRPGSVVPPPLPPPTHIMHACMPPCLQAWRLLLFLRCQCILFRRYPAVLRPFKYAGYPQLLQVRGGGEGGQVG